jgi:hypothetical protein
MPATAARIAVMATRMAFGFFLALVWAQGSALVGLLVDLCAYFGHGLLDLYVARGDVCDQRPRAVFSGLVENAVSAPSPDFISANPVCTLMLRVDGDLILVPTRLTPSRLKDMPLRYMAFRLFVHAP